LETASVELRCRVWGRFGAGAVREKLGLKHGMVKGRMTHGTVVIVKEEVGAEGGRRRGGEEVAEEGGRGYFWGEHDRKF